MVNTRPSPSFGQLVRRYRHVAGLTQEALAERAGISARAVSDLERDMGRKPRRATVDRLVHALDLDAAEIAALRSAAQLRDARLIPIKSVRKGQATPTHLPADYARLPADVTTLVGRDDDIAAVATLLQKPDVRLVTLTGVGGVGKTRVAVRVAQEVADLFPDGVVFVALAPVRDVGLVISTINAAVGVAEAPGRDPLDALAAALHRKHALLVLDNVEQVRDAAPSLIDLLGRCPGIRLMVTSRAMLRVRGERVFVVHPLATPDPTIVDAGQGVMRYASVQLFVERAQDIMPGFALTASNVRTVAAVCVRLEGLPLAIELAAARVNALTPTALLARLESRLSVLVGGARDAPERQQTLRDTLAWSYGLLTTDEQAYFRRLAVFVGGWTLDAASAVCGHEGTPAEALARVAALVDTHLAHMVTRGDGREPRFDMLDTVREYAWDMLAADGAEHRAAEAHARYFLALAEDAARAFGRPDQGAWFDRLEREHGNLRSALGWLLDRGDAVGALRLVGSLTHFWYVRGYLIEGRRWVERALAVAPVDDARTDPTAARASLLVGAGNLATNQGDTSAAVAFYRQALALYEATEDRTGRVSTLISLGWMLFERGDYTQAATALEEALVDVDDREHAVEAAEVLLNLGHVALAQGDQACASDRYETSLGRYRAMGIRRGESYGLLNLGWVRVAQRTDREAVAFFRDALAIMQSLGDVWGHASCLEGLAVTTFSGATDRARTAVVICAAAATARAVIGAAPSEVARAQVEETLARARATLGTDSYEAAWGEGQAIDLEQATILAAPQR
jgi:predicted ATPase/transcriptional regulator with XRE-family HTH domain